MNSPIDTSYCRIEVPGAGLTIQLRRSLLERLAADIQEAVASSGRESGGILLGSLVSGRTLVVEDYDPVPSRHLADARCYLHADVDRPRMASALALWSPTGESRLRVIGFYRSSVRPALIAGEEERKLFARELGDATSLLLLAEPGANRLTALACYLAKGEWLGDREGRLEIDLSQPEAPAAGEPAPDTECQAKPPAMPDRHGKSSSGLARIAAIGIAVGLVWVGFQQYRILKSMSAEASSARRRAALGLEVQPAGPFWRVSWNRSSEWLAGAARGHLRIEDGPVRKDVDLDAAALENTSIIYDPAGSEIWFHLEVFGVQGGRSTAESLRVFATRPPAAPVEAAAAGLRAIARDGLDTAGIAQEPGPPNSPSLTILPLR
jgi:hypothetical protein